MRFVRALQSFRQFLKGRRPAPRALQDWQRTPDLAGVRDPAALAQLPETERQPWRLLWADVAKTLATAGAATPP
jgi:hypothetical protein